jgi:hypothetical protein
VKSTSFFRVRVVSVLRRPRVHLSPGVAFKFVWPRRHTAQCTGELLCLLNPFSFPCCVLSPGVLAFVWPRRHTVQCTGSDPDHDLALFFARPSSTEHGSTITESALLISGFALLIIIGSNNSKFTTIALALSSSLLISAFSFCQLALESPSRVFLSLGPDGRMVLDLGRVIT